MFSNLSRGSILHGVDKSGDELKWFTGTIERITPSLNSPYNGYPSAYGQLPGVSLDIVANIDGKQREFKGVHADEVVADFGKNTVILADSEGTLFNHVNSLLKTSEAAVNKDNIASQKVMLKNGARMAGEDDRHYFMRIPKSQPASPCFRKGISVTDP
jgi:hypothetical protein